ncbi:MAG: PPC domain-containing protein [Bryobacteraceae bacterium]
MSTRFLIHSTLALGMATGIAWAEPSIGKIEPRGGQRGKSLTLVLKGSGLTEGARIETSIPGTLSRLSPAKEAKEGAELPFLLELKTDASVGLYPVRVVTEEGVSNVMLFSVGAFPEMEEKETDNPKASNGSLQSAEQVESLPVTINGTLTPADVDLFEFAVRTPQKLVFEVEAASAASAIDPAIEILDAAGKKVAHNDDAEPSGIDSRLEHAFTKPGTYYLRVHDSKYSSQKDNFYRVKVGAYPYHEAMFPLGGKRGQPAAVELIGGNLTKNVRVDVETQSRRRWIPVPLDGSASLPALFELSDKTEAIEPETETGVKALLAGGVINGRIGVKGEVDKYRLPVKAGEEWIVVLTAASTGASFLDALVTVTDSAGKKIESRDDLGGSDPVIPFTVPKDVTEVIVTVEDLQGRGGPGYGYRLEARKEAADFEVTLLTPYVNVPAGGTEIVQARIQRRGYDGPMRLWIENLPNGFAQAGGTVAPSAASQRFDDPNPRFGANTSTITITAEPGVAPQTANLRVVAIAELEGGGRIVREAEGPGLMTTVRGGRGSTVTARWLEMDLPMGVDRATGVKLASPISYARIAQGVEYPLTVKLTGASMKSMGLRQNVATQVGNLRINQGQESTTPNEGTLYVNTNFATPLTSFDFLPQVNVTRGGEQVNVYAPIITFEVVPGYQIWPAANQWSLTRGGTLQIAGNVHREPTFEGGIVRIEAQDLPEGVTCAAAEVAAADRGFSIACNAAADAATGTHEVRLVSQAPDTGRKAKDTYKGPEVNGKLRVE